MFEALVIVLEPVDPFDPKTLETIVHGFAEQRGGGLGNVAQPVRVALTGGTASPSLFEVIALCGKPIVLKRLRRAMQCIRAGK